MPCSGVRQYQLWPAITGWYAAVSTRRMFDSAVLRKAILRSAQPDLAVKQFVLRSNCVLCVFFCHFLFLLPSYCVCVIIGSTGTPYSTEHYSRYVGSCSVDSKLSSDCDWYLQLIDKFWKGYPSSVPEYTTKRRERYSIDPVIWITLHYSVIVGVYEIYVYRQPQ